MSERYSAGVATAYGAALRGGYTGTYNDFCNDVAKLGNITEELGSISATATTLEAGSSATASYNGGVFSFGIPRGNTGAQGERGETGAKGDKGDTGETGATGATGNGIASIAKTATVGLVDTYTITFTDGTTTTFDVTNGTAAIDDSLSIAGRAADAKATGDAVDDLKEDLSYLGVNTDLIDISAYDTITGTIQSDGTWGGYTSTNNYASALITVIPKTINVTAQATHNAYVSFFYKKPNQPTTSADQVFFCDGETGRHAIPMNTTASLEVPTDCKCIVVTTINAAVNYVPTLVGTFAEYDLSDISESVTNIKSYLYGIEYTKSDATALLTIASDKLTHVWIGSSYANVLTGSLGAWSVRVPCKGYSTVTYPVFVTSQDLGGVFLNSNDIVIGGNANKTEATGTYVTIDIPENAEVFVLNITSAMNQADWYVKLTNPSVSELNNDIKALKNAPSLFKSENRNMCLAGIKTDILTNKIPYHRGFLFHKLQNNDGSLWYGTDFRNISQIGSVSFNPNSMRFAISPKDGRIIAVQRDTRNGIYVWDGETETHVTGFTLEPMAWLYNSGVEFINDGTDEYCIFAEYKASTPYDSFNVWRGKYPYTSVSDWEIVLTQTPSEIGHFHQVRRDPWGDILYLTSGDDSAMCKWWYSTDCGATWTLLTTGTTSGYEDHICRCINFVFTADYVYWATDKGTNHCLNRASRDSNGIIDVASRYKLCDLPSSYATNSICYVESPHGIFMYDRIDIGYTADYGNPVSMKFWDIDKAELTTIVTLPLTTSDWGGSRGKCYVNYTNSKQPMPAMGFSIDTPCIFDLVCDNPSNIGSIAYGVGSKTIHTINY